MRTGQPTYRVSHLLLAASCLALAQENTSLSSSFALIPCSNPFSHNRYRHHGFVHHRCCCQGCFHPCPAHREVMNKKWRVGQEGGGRLSALDGPLRAYMCHSRTKPEMAHVHKTWAYPAHGGVMRCTILCRPASARAMQSPPRGYILMKHESNQGMSCHAVLLIQALPSPISSNSTSLHEVQGQQAKTFMAAAAAAVSVE